MNEDEGKEGRYFPTENEISTLAKYIQIYFSHPERSAQRSQVVQQVFAILAPQNPHWDQRKIRLWFNNNKKIYLKGLTDQDITLQKDPTRIQYNPARKMYPPPRSHSASPFATDEFLSDRSYSTPGSPPSPNDQTQLKYQSQDFAIAEQYKIIRPEPKPGTFADQLRTERNFILQNSMDLLESQAQSEVRLSGRIFSLYDTFWSQSISANHQIPIISDPTSLPQTPNLNNQESPNLLSILNLNPYDYIESADGHDIVAYSLEKNERLFFYSNPQDPLNKINTTLNFSAPVLSMVRDPNFPFTWLHCSSHLIRVPNQPNTNSDNSEIAIFNSEILTEGHRSALTIWNNQLVLGCGAHVNSYSINPDESFQLIRGLNLFHQSLSSITSLCSINQNRLAVASCEHHAVHIYASNGALFSCNVYHSAGITSLGQYSTAERNEEGDNSTQTFLSGGAEGIGLLWDLRTAFPVQSFIKHFGPITSIYGNEENQIIVTGGVDGFVKAWDIRAARCMGRIDLGNTAICSLKLNNESKIITAITSKVLKDQYYGLWEKPEIDMSPNSEVLIQIQ